MLGEDEKKSAQAAAKPAAKPAATKFPDSDMDDSDASADFQPKKKVVTLHSFPLQVSG